MRRIAAISAVVLVVAVFACLLSAQDQPDPFGPVIREKVSPLSRIQAQRPGRPGLGAQGGPIGEPNDVGSRVSGLADDFSKALTSGLQEKVINAEQADRMAKELEIAFTVKRARIDLLRVSKMLQKLDENTKGVEGSDELGDLRHELKEFETAAGLVEEEAIPPQDPTLATEPEQPKLE